MLEVTVAEIQEELNFFLGVLQVTTVNAPAWIVTGVPLLSLAFLVVLIVFEAS